MAILYPDLQLPSIRDIDPDRLYQQGIRGIIFDLDHTVFPWHNYRRDEALIEWFAMLKKKGFQVCILSNSMQEKVQPVGDMLGISVFGGAGKPRRSGYLRVCAAFHLQPRQIAIVGDQLLTDMAGARRIGAYAILVKPIGGREFWGTHLFSRNIEKLIRLTWNHKQRNGNNE